MEDAKALESVKDLEGVYELSVEGEENQEEVEKTDLRGVDSIPAKPPWDPSIKELFRQWKDRELIIDPDFQRHSVWDIGKSSRLIESALLKMPLPTIYLSEEEDGSMQVIDGQQRLTAFFAFMEGHFPLGTGKPFKLKGLTTKTDLEGKTFTELDKPTRSDIERFTMRVVVLLRGCDPNLKYEIFRRLNTGAVALNQQELRNCIYRGKYNNLLKKLSKDKDFVWVLTGGNSSKNSLEKRMKDVELVLRFASFYNWTHEKYIKGPKFLNNDMEKYRDIKDKEVRELTVAFKKFVGITKSLFAEHSFRRFERGDEDNPSGKWGPFNTAIYDTFCYLGYKSIQKPKIIKNLDCIREAILHLMTEDEKFIDQISLATTDEAVVKSRHERFKKLIDEIVKTTRKEPRSFSKQLKEEMYKQDKTCRICQQEITHIDDAALDHKEQYWKGGKTVPQNARLAHRYCNCARPKDD